MESPIQTPIGKGVRKIAHVLPSFEVGGQEVFVQRLAARLVERGWPVLAVGVTGSGPLEQPITAAGVTVRIAGGSGPIPGYPSGLIRTLRAEAPDVLHCHSGTWFPTAIAGRVLGCKVVHTEHGRYPDEPGWVRWADRLAYMLTDTVVMVSHTLDVEFRRRLRTARPFHTIANGVTVPAVNARDREHARARLGVDEGSVVVGTVGRQVPAKNHAGLIAAFAALASERRPVTLVLIGDGPLRGDLERLAGELEVADRVRFLGHRADATELLPGLDLYVSSSVTEGTPIAVLEAMAAGRAIIATDVGGLSHLLDGGNAGVLVTSNSSASLTDAIRALIEDGHRRQELGNRARERAAATFSLDAAVSQYEEIYRSI